MSADPASRGFEVKIHLRNYACVLDISAFFKLGKNNLVFNVSFRILNTAIKENKETKQKKQHSTHKEKNNKKKI